MDLFTILGTCLRRWYVVLPVLAISGYFAMQAYEAVEPQYTASTSIVILPSQTLPGEEGAVETPTLENPYAGSGGPKLAAAVLAKNIDSSSFRDRLGMAPDDTSTFEASVAQTQPIITVDAMANSPEAAIATLDAVTESARVVLDEFQAVAEAPEAKRYLVAAAVPVSNVTDVTPSRWRTAGAILVVGAGLAALLAVALDAALKARRRDAVLAADVPPAAQQERPEQPEPDARAPERDAAADEVESIGRSDGREAAIDPDESEASPPGRSSSTRGGAARPVAIAHARASVDHDK
ncbi:hypothetical protein [Pengzhenrongella frigida]|uniref:Lipopolysaccharide biosynthesis protein n=1 Tax=Pengzhenrongella frigida TaxID=1259133 RepID=A0A4V1ZH46_9MICO|nr:hypothetical protein [Cellulomonas sp. HLT2-17]RYV50774.1 hypothetical protein EUA98_12040 [Cellulomonas sp. HLT2-17]